MSWRMVSSSNSQVLDVGVGQVRECRNVGDSHRSVSFLWYLRYRNLRPRRLPASKVYASSTQSPDAAEMHVCTRLPGSCSTPDRRSRTCPSSRPTTQDWQMPIRQPNGICTPAPSPASISGVAASTVTVFPLRANSTVPPSPCTAPREAAKRSRCSCSLRPAADQTCSAAVQHALRPARPGLPIAPIGHLVVELRTGRGGRARASCAAASGSRGGCAATRPARRRTSDRIPLGRNANGRCR